MLRKSYYTARVIDMAWIIKRSIKKGKNNKD